MNTLCKDSFGDEFKRGPGGKVRLKICSIITAGGTSSRFGSNKLLEEIETEDGLKTSVVLASVRKFIPYSDFLVIPCRDDVREHIKNSSLYKGEEGGASGADDGGGERGGRAQGVFGCKAGYSGGGLTEDKKSSAGTGAESGKAAGRAESKNNGAFGPEAGCVIKFAQFGNTRQQSVFNGLSECAGFNPDIVLIHDGARPFVQKETIEKTIEKLKECKKESAKGEALHEGVCVGVYATDTVKIVGGGGEILKTIDRKTVFLAQTPQGFLFKTIYEAHKKLKDKSFTDDASMLEYLNIPVFALEGSLLNKKITFREDLGQAAL